MFDFDTDTLRPRYQQQINDLLHGFNRETDHLLLIGRASPIGPHAYNVALSGKRAGAIKDYVTGIHAVAAEHIRYLYFGDGAPQLTLELATAYGVQPEELARIDIGSDKTSAADKINQSVVVFCVQAKRELSPADSLMG